MENINREQLLAIVVDAAVRAEDRLLVAAFENLTGKRVYTWDDGFFDIETEEDI